MLFGKRTNLFGLDIGSNALKLTEIRKTGKGYQLLNAGVMHLPPEAIVEGAIMNAPAVVDAIRNLLDVHKPESRNVATSVCGHSVIIKKVSLPIMSGKSSTIHPVGSGAVYPFQHPRRKPRLPDSLPRCGEGR